MLFSWLVGGDAQIRVLVFIQRIKFTLNFTLEFLFFFDKSSRINGSVILSERWIDETHNWLKFRCNDVLTYFSNLFVDILIKSLYSIPFDDSNNIVIMEKMHKLLKMLIVDLELMILHFNFMNIPIA